MPERVFLDLPANMNFHGLTPHEQAKLEARFEWLLKCRKVTIHPDPMNARKGWIDLYRDPPKEKIDWLNDVGPWPGPTGGIDKPIPIGRDEHGGLVYITMLYNNLLIGGIPGAGKSVAMGMVMATGALDPTCDIWTIDGGGGVEMKVWRSRASRKAISEKDAFLLLQDLKAEIDARLEILMNSDRQKFDPGEPSILLGIEELASYTAKEKRRCYDSGELAGPKDQGETFTEALTYGVRLGRKVSVMVAANTQRPSATVVDPNLRDLLGTGLALYCKTGTSSDTIIGDGWRRLGYNAAKLNRSRKGSFILSPETDTPVRGRCFLVEGDDLRKIAARSVLLDAEEEEDSLAPVALPVLDTDTISAELCLETDENVVALPVSPVAQDAAQPAALVLGAWDRAVLEACTFPKTRAEITSLVASGGDSTVRRRLKALTDAGYLSSARTTTTDPLTYVTTLAGRAGITPVKVSTIPDIKSDAQPSDLEVSTTEGRAQ